MASFQLLDTSCGYGDMVTVWWEQLWTLGRVRRWDRRQVSRELLVSEFHSLLGDSGDSRDRFALVRSAVGAG